MKNTLFKYLSFGLLGLITLVLMSATVIEKFYGSAFVGEHIYTSEWMIILWGVTAHFTLFYIVRRRLYVQYATFALHLSFLMIIVGAFVTHNYGVQGRVHLREGEPAVGEFTAAGGSSEAFPFSLQLKKFELRYYKGTFAPMDYVSHIIVEDAAGVREGCVSMNNIFKYRGYRFYQSGYDADSKGASLAVSHDPYGIGITYAGYIALLLAMIAFFFQRGTMFRGLLAHPALRRGAAFFVAFYLCGSLWAAPQSVPRDVARSMCNLRVYYNDRVCPLGTLAKDFTAKLYGKTSYDGLSAEQVLAGWFFFYDEWKHEPMIKIKGAGVRGSLGIDGDYAALTDFTSRDGYKLDALLRSDNPTLRNGAEAANEKFSLVSMLCTGSLLRIYPYAGEEGGTLLWYSFTDRLPSSVPYEQWLFITNSMSLVAEQIAMRNWDEAVRLLDKIGQYQLREAGDALPADWRFDTEILYNDTNYNKPLAMFALTMGILSFMLFILRGRIAGLPSRILRLLLWMLLAYITLHTVMRAIIGGYVPLSNGFETMMFMSWCSVALTLVVERKYQIALPFGFLLCGLTMLVAMMGEATPKITQLMPVLQSPLLSIHVVVIMLAYTLLAFMMLSGLSAVILHFLNRRAEVEYLYLLGRLMLYPALFLLAAGIFIGAVWANVSWGRYWGWDPKEVWALVTMIVYSYGLHVKSFPLFGRPLLFHIFCIVAFITVIITYFGVNFILGGMHSYA